MAEQTTKEKKEKEKAEKKKFNMETIDQIPGALDTLFRTKSPETWYNKAVNAIEKSVRSSYEYKLWVKLINKVYQKKYKFICGCCGRDYEDVGLGSNVHHTPLNLAEITKSVIESMCETSEMITTATIIDHILSLHIDNKVNNIVVCECCHKILHNEKKIYGEEVSLSQPKKKTGSSKKYPPGSVDASDLDDDDDNDDSEL